MLSNAGMEPGSWQIPLFLCDELQSPALLPVFLSRASLVEVSCGREHCPSAALAEVVLAFGGDSIPLMEGTNLGFIFEL